MADQTFKNVINGELVDSASRETYDIIDPTTGGVYARAPMSGGEDVDRLLVRQMDQDPRLLGERLLVEQFNDVGDMLKRQAGRQNV